MNFSFDLHKLSNSDQFLSALKIPEHVHRTYKIYISMPASFTKSFNLLLFQETAGIATRRLWGVANVTASRILKRWYRKKGNTESSHCSQQRSLALTEGQHSGLGRMLPTPLPMAEPEQLSVQRSWPQAPLIPMLIHTSAKILWTENSGKGRYFTPTRPIIKEKKRLKSSFFLIYKPS